MKFSLNSIGSRENVTRDVMRLVQQQTKKMGRQNNKKQTVPRKCQEVCA